MLRSWIILSLLAVSAEAFVPVKMSTTRTSSSVGSFWRHWIPETDFLGLDNKDEESQQEILENSKTVFLGAALAAVLMLAPQVTLAVSGGGLDYANIDITGQNFSNGNYKGKDFTQVIAKGTNFANSNLQGCRFYKAYLVRSKTDCIWCFVQGKPKRYILLVQSAPLWLILTQLFLYFDAFLFFFNILGEY